MNQFMFRTLAILLTVTVASAHIFRVRFAGALWRDESQAAAIAAMPSFSELWTYLEHESFPILWTMIVRIFGGGSAMEDMSYRILGCAVGLGLVAVLWFSARQSNTRMPFLSLALLGFSPTIVLWGDSMRSYGLGVVLILLTFVLIYRVCKSPTRLGVIAAGISAILAVQASYHNAPILLAMGIAGWWLQRVTNSGAGCQ